MPCGENEHDQTIVLDVVDHPIVAHADAYVADTGGFVDGWLAGGAGPDAVADDRVLTPEERTDPASPRAPGASARARRMPRGWGFHGASALLRRRRTTV